MGKSSIEWVAGEDGSAGRTWNPIKARQKEEMKLHLHGGLKIIPAGKIGYHCEHVSPGCVNCYAEAMNKRTLPAWGTGSAFNVPNRERVEIFLDEEVLLAPLKWKVPSRIFPCSMTDLFAEFVPDEFIERMWGVMRLCPQHTFLPLTKRADRMYEWFKKYFGKNHCVEVVGIGTGNVRSALWMDPLPNVHVGVSVENDEWALRRVPWLVKSPGQVRWISYEPALGPVDWTFLKNGMIGWVVVGGESGHGARHFDIYWAKQAVEQCKAAGVPVFVKQLGSKPMYRSHGDDDPRHLFNGLQDLYCNGQLLKDRKGGDMAEWPHYLRVRQYPNASA